MESIAFKVEGDNAAIIGCTVSGYDIGVDVTDSNNCLIFNNNIDSEVSAIRLRRSRKNRITKNRVEKINSNYRQCNVTLMDLIRYLMHNSNIDSRKIIEIYIKLNRSWHEKVYK